MSLIIARDKHAQTEEMDLYCFMFCAWLHAVLDFFYFFEPSNLEEKYRFTHQLTNF